jgi:hypothetical protein
MDGAVLDALVKGLVEVELVGALLVHAALEGLSEMRSPARVSAALHTNVIVIFELEPTADLVREHPNHPQTAKQSRSSSIGWSMVVWRELYCQFQ